MISIKTKHINKEIDVINYRQRVFKSLRILTNDNTLSVKVASIISSFLKELITLKHQLRIHTNVIIYQELGKKIQLLVEDNTKTFTLPPPSLYVHFLTIEKIENHYLITVEQEFSARDFKLALNVYNEKSRDELLEEVQSKNNDLEASLADLKKANDSKARMQGELIVGRNIQLSMVPTDFPSNSFIDVHGILVPAREVGGDFYDFQFINDKYFYFVVGDVSGKGVPAALLMAQTKSLLRSSAINETSTSEIVSHVNSEIAKDNKNNMFITVFLALLDLETGVLTYTNAGHNPSYIINNENMQRLEELHGPVVGALEGFSYKEKSIQLSPSDIVFAYTDGVTEAQNQLHQLYSDERLTSLLTTVTNKNVKEINDIVIKDIEEFELGSEQADDITVLSIQYHQSNDNQEGTFSISNSFDEKLILTQKVEKYLLQKNVPTKALHKTQIILDEILSNAINYSFTNTATPLISVSLKVDSTEICIKIMDNGVAFNPLEKEDPNVALSLDERQVGGLGIFIIKNLVEELSYERFDNKNCLRLLQKI
ncbi:ATP-binding SpoIIE family protein phosphatase [Flammeovirga kamogawensis]|uniref:SpoIIE family protein phosphatase n=1 Tax=Flammeovirga kamogawensis TaxID=373891 RepID=A0ABX8H5T7_9BACT|nr:SpoIIE family protein phosphatase [Flammeovirga kamogawensis]MBB6461835.1 sigma-B regulation protein RsbU (phosphoserine phosphatase) [Flammeovirga kamogawensis]QWG10550.1 SpoIIE family protein phosphatase [Flammeovirga kamogawensis]TRX63658.1 SpoIIE family protein phosphatase [Flammeovirga kamogawensis]